eukprot:3182148-Amphidinium_carterae.1
MAAEAVKRQQQDRSPVRTRAAARTHTVETWFIGTSFEIGASLQPFCRKSAAHLDHVLLDHLESKDSPFFLRVSPCALREPIKLLLWDR